MNETDIQKTICEYLSYRKDLFFCRMNNIPIYDPTRKAYRSMPKYARSGMPDIMIIQNGKYIGIEVKKPKPKTYQSKEQKLIESEIKANGGKYFVVRSLDDLLSSESSW